MFLNTRQLTVSGALLAISIILIYLGNVIESSTLFLLSGYLSWSLSTCVVADSSKE